MSMDLNVQDWKEFKIGRLFKTNIAKSLDFSNTNAGNNLYIGRTSINNGVQGRVSAPTVEDGNCIIIGMVGENWAFYQTEPFVASQNIFVLRNDNINYCNAMFLCTILSKCIEVFRDTYSLPLGKEKMNNRDIKLPIQYNLDGMPVIDSKYIYSDDGYIPDWNFMESYIKQLHYKPITTSMSDSKSPSLDVDEWGEFVLGDLFQIKKGKRLTSADQEDGDNNYIGAIDSNNGIANRIGQVPIHKGNTITLSYNGSVGEAFYQKDAYWATDDVNALYCKYEGFNCKIGLFISTVIRQEKYKFTYGRKWTLDNMNKTIIKLPIQRDVQENPIIDSDKKYSEKGYIPDWQFMEDYINSLPYSDRI